MEQLAGFLPFILIAVVFWLLIVRPQRRRQHELASTQNSVTPGSEVMLGSGIYGTVTSVEDETVHLDVAPGTTLKVARQAVVRVLDDHEDVDAVDDRTEEITSEDEPGSAGPADEQHQ